MKRAVRHIELLILFAVMPLLSSAQNEDLSGAAGTDFYFTLFDHWNWNGMNDYDGVKHCGVTICAVEDADLTFSTPINTGAGGASYTFHMGAGWTTLAGFMRPQDAVLNGVHIHSTGACYIHIWVHGTTAGAESAILPKHLLGKQYMLQGIPGALIEQNDSYFQTHSQFTIVGTENNTSVTITPRTPLVEGSINSAVYSAGQPATFTLNESEVLRLQPLDYTQDISGTFIEADKPVAVFQGNDLTQFPAGNNWADYTWEQARPTTAWGKEFIVAGSGRLVEKMFAITALEDDTEVEFYTNSLKYKTITLNRGETGWGGENISGYGGLSTEYVKASKPVCCYLYSTSSSLNNDVGDPSMTEIVPLDNPAKEARWSLIQTEDNSPNKASLLVTTLLSEEEQVQFNNQPLTSYMTQSGVERTVLQGYVTYEIPIAISLSNRLTSKDAGFSAYVIKIGKTAEASAFNVSLPFEEPDDLCMDGILIYQEDFGGNDPEDPEISTASVPGMDPNYSNAGNGSMGSFRYMIRKKGWKNGIQWHLQDDHTHFGDYTRGYLLEVDGGGGSIPFYSTTVNGLAAGAKLTFSAYVVNVTYAGQIPYLQQNFGYVYPRMRFVFKDPDTGEIIASKSTGNIQPDATKVWDVNLSESADWQLVGMTFTVPDGVTRAELAIYNDVVGSGSGNDFALDDIEVRLCMPPITISGEDTVCAHFPAELLANSEYTTLTDQPVVYKWWHSVDSIEWTEIEGASSARLYIPDVQLADSGWYRVAIALAGNIDSENGRSMSEPFWLSTRPFTDCAPPVSILSLDTVCIDTKNILTALCDNRGILPEPLEYQWYFSTDSLTWSALSEGTAAELKLKAKPRHTGWYCVAVSGTGHIHDSAYCVFSEPVRFYVIEECPPILCADGILLFREDFGGAVNTCDTVLRELCADLDLSFIVNLQPGHPVTRLLLRLIDPVTGTELRAYDTGDVPSDSLQVGTSFTVPEGISSIRWTITNNDASLVGTPLPIDNTEIRLCLEPISINPFDSVCRKQPHTLQAVYDNYGILYEPEYQWFFSPDSAVWTPVQVSHAPTYTIPAVHRADEGWYRVTVAETGNSDQVNCRSVSEPVRLDSKYCGTATDQFIDTLVCDTLMPVSWRTYLWQQIGSVIDTLRDFEHDDSVYVHLTLSTQKCCPDIRREPVQLWEICDTLMPYTWFFRDTALVFTDISDVHYVEIPHPRWDCTDSIYILRLDTVHCEKLWPVIVHKYNRVLLLDNVRFRQFFPGHTILSLQWFRDEQPIPDATEDDYSEQDELHGRFQLFIRMDGDEHAWSNIIELLDTTEPLPVTKRVYNSMGVPVREDQMTRGVYLIYYEQGNDRWTEKKIVL